MNNLVILTDYKGFFGSKQKSKVYRGGMDIEMLTKHFKDNGFHVKICTFADVDLAELLKLNPAIIYTSSEDLHGNYKSYIEDVILLLENAGLFIIPTFKQLRAHNNKVCMEMLRESAGLEMIKTIKTKYFGTFEELAMKADNIELPAVIKTHSGAMSRGVRLARTRGELLRFGRDLCKSPNMRHDLKEIGRSVKYKGYIRESKNRNKFIVQTFIPGLSNDWKILVYGDKYYILFRGNRANDFRASGSGNFQFRRDIPDGILDYAEKVFDYFNVPNISLDVGFDGNKFHLIEFQFLYFGTTTLEKSPLFFTRKDNKWEIVEETSSLEQVYADSIVRYIERTAFDHK